MRLHQASVHLALHVDKVFRRRLWGTPCTFLNLLSDRLLHRFQLPRFAQTLTSLRETTLLSWALPPCTVVHQVFPDRKRGNVGLTWHPSQCTVCIQPPALFCPVLQSCMIGGLVWFQPLFHGRNRSNTDCPFSEGGIPCFLPHFPMNTTSRRALLSTEWSSAPLHDLL